MVTFEKLAEAVFQGNSDDVVAIVKALLDGGANPLDIINKGLLTGMDIVTPKFRDGEMFIPEVIMCANALEKGMGVVRPFLSADDSLPNETVIIGTVAGDLHDIGKNLVVMVLRSGGFNVIDLGVDVSPEAFVKAIQEYQPRIVGMSALLTTTMTAMQLTINAITVAGARDKVKILIGGAPVSQGFADEIGADAYCADAISAKEICSRIIGSI
jgi:5-methyltetrahydrofolate--homocysteine methyltransferase